METFLILCCLLSASLIIYNHVGYPILLSWYRKNRPLKLASVALRKFKKNKKDSVLPRVSLIVPAYNEARWIQEKIRNIASLDYPREKLCVVIACDGCTDNTAELAELAIQEAICADVHFEIVNFTHNRGKIAVINELVTQATSDIVALSDVSALLSIDSLQIAAQSFQDERVGVVNPNYCMTFGGKSDEEKYWQYQASIKGGEASLGATIGCHGAFYLFRRSLFQPLDHDTINDDFVLPMKIVKQGYIAIFEPRINAVELEESSHKDDFKRRLRISAGNMQQVLRLFHLFKPKYTSTAFTFFSGKGLRLLTPYLMMVCFVCSFLLADTPFFFFALVAQIALYSIGLACYSLPSLRNNKIMSVISYLLAGHLANFIGGIHYLLSGQKHDEHPVKTKHLNI